MPTSEDRIIANRNNASRSTGPRTAEGKERSRRNGLKHGLTGQGVVIPESDLGEVERRTAVLQAEMAPRSALGLILIGQMARLSVQLERGATRESAATAARVRHAAEAFDEDQHEEAERWMAGLAENPRRHVRKLRQSPAGVARLIEAWRDLRADLTRQPRALWTFAHGDRAENLIGRRLDDFGLSPIKALSTDILKTFNDTAENSPRAQLVERIDAEIAGLEDHRATLNLEILELDCQEASARAAFDLSDEAALGRRYEAASQRAFFKAIQEFRQVEAEAIDPTTPPPATEPAPPLASSCPPKPPTVRDPIPTPPSPTQTRPTDDFSTNWTPKGRPVEAGRPNSSPA